MKQDTMTEVAFPSPKETHNKHFSDRFAIGVRYSENDSHDTDNFIGGIPKETPFFTVTLTSGSHNSETWNRLAEAYENEGFQTHLRTSNGTSTTRSGTCKHAPTQLYVW